MATKHVKFLSLILALVMIFSLLPMSVLAEEAAPAQTAEQTQEAASAQSVAITGSNTYQGVTANVSAPAGAFPAGTKLTITPVGTWYDNVGAAVNKAIESVKGVINDLFNGKAPTDAQVQDTVKDIKDAINNVTDTPVSDMVAFDITFTDASGAEVQPAAGFNVDVTFDVSASSKLGDAKDLSVFHMEKQTNGDTKPVEMDAEVSGDRLSVDAHSFSIYVVGKPATATYTFYNAAGNVLTGTDYTQIVKNGEKLTEPTAPVIDGKSFLGWYTVQTGGDKFDFSQAVTVSGNSDTTVKLYARYADGYTINFYTPDGSKVMHTEVVTNHNAHDFSAVTYDVDANHAVTGWAYQENGTKDVSNTVTVPTDKTSLNLYAIVQEAHWLTFNTNGGTAIDPVYVLSGDNTVKPTDPTRAGYTFDDWYTDDRLKTPFVFGSTLGASTALYAKWTANTNTNYTVIYWQENANDTGYSLKESDTKTGTTDTQTVATAAKTYEGFTAQTITQATINGDGSTIVNVYYTRNVYTINFYQGVKYNNTPYTTNDKIDALTITAKYGADISKKWPSMRTDVKDPGGNTYTSNWWTGKSEGKTNIYQSGISTMPLDGASFYLIDGGTYYTIKTYYYVETLSGVFGTTTYKNKQYKLDHTDTFSSDIKSWSTSKEDHYDIKGFTYANNLADGSHYQQEDLTTYSVTFYYTRNSYAITFINGKDITTVTKQYEADISNASIAPTARDGYTFGGWYENEACEGTAYSFAGKTMPAQNITLYAKWNINQYTVTFNSNGGSKVTAEKVNYNDLATEPDAPTKAGYTFAGWTYNDAGTVKPFSFATQITSDVILTAKWIPTGQFAVVYDDGGEGSGTLPSDKNYYAGGALITLLAPTGLNGPKGKPYFLGWRNGDTVYYPNGTVSVADAVKGIGNFDHTITFTALWGAEAPTATINYEPNFPTGVTGAGSVYTQTVKNNADCTLYYGSSFSCSGYTLVGWNTATDGTGSAYKLGQTNAQVDGTNTLYAVWAKLSATPYSGTYDGNAHTITASVSPTGYTIEYSKVGGAEATDWSTTAPTWTDVTTAQTVYVKATNSNNVYAPLTATATVTITPAAVTVTADAASKAFAEKDPSFTAKVSGMVNGESDSLISYTVSRPGAGTDEAVGTYTDAIVPTGEATQGNYSVTYKSAAFEIKTNETALTISGNDGGGVYTGNAYTLNDVAASLPGATIEYKVGEGEWSAKAPSATAVAESQSKTISVRASMTGYKTAELDGLSIIVTPAAVTVTANDKSKTYGEKDPALDATVTGLVNGEDVNLITYKVTRAAGEDVGTYAITPAGDATQGNYSVTYNPGTFTIKAVPFVPGPDPDIKDPDVPKADLNTTDHYAYIIGMPDGLVHPEQNITRGEVATIFFRMLTDESRTANWKTTNSYKDVPATLWCNNAISTLSNAGIIKGYDDGTFRPNAPITRAEFATMAVRFFESKYNGNDKFSDIATSWARQYINAASEAGIIKGYTDGTFRPTKLITRAEAVTIMNRALLRTPDKDHLLADMKVWPDNQVLTKWYYADMQEATNSHDYTMPEDESVTYETWTKMQAVRDWAKFETEWATANASTNPGEVVTPVTPSTGTSGS